VLRLPRRPFVALAVSSLLLAACGGGGDGDGSVAAGNGNSDVATGGRLFSTADEATAALGSDAAPGEFPRTVTHALGTAELDAAPERVVVLDTGELDSVLALGVTPVGYAITDGQVGPPEYLAEDLPADVPTVGAIAELDLEAIAALEPDLILGSQLRVEQLYPQLSAIAPTVLSIRPGYPWKENLLLVGEALGREDRAEELLNDYQARADAISESLAASGALPTVSLVRFLSADRLRLYGNLSFIGVVLRDVGLPRPAVQDVEDLAVEISPERITEADADILFYTSYGPAGASQEDVVVGGPLWPTIPAVAQGRAHRVDDGTWFLGLGYLGAVDVLDDLEGFLAP
jgi:iron complex transport system substrate-binding protein